MLPCINKVVSDLFLSTVKLVKVTLEDTGRLTLVQSVRKVTFTTFPELIAAVRASSSKTESTRRFHDVAESVPPPPETVLSETESPEESAAYATPVSTAVVVKNIPATADFWMDGQRSRRRECFMKRRSQNNSHEWYHSWELCQFSVDFITSPTPTSPAPLPSCILLQGR